MFLAPAREKSKAPSGATCSVLVSPLRGLVAVGLSGTTNRTLQAELRWPAIRIEDESKFPRKAYPCGRKQPSPRPSPLGRRGRGGMVPLVSGVRDFFCRMDCLRFSLSRRESAGARGTRDPTASWWKATACVAIASVRLKAGVGRMLTLIVGNEFGQSGSVLICFR